MEHSEQREQGIWTSSALVRICSEKKKKHLREWKAVFSSYLCNTDYRHGNSSWCPGELRICPFAATSNKIWAQGNVLTGRDYLIHEDRTLDESSLNRSSGLQFQSTFSLNPFFHRDLSITQAHPNFLDLCVWAGMFFIWITFIYLFTHSFNYLWCPWFRLLYLLIASVLYISTPMHYLWLHSCFTEGLAW